MGGLESLSGVMGLIAVVFLIVVSIAWTLLPFAMFGLKPLLRDLLAETRRSNQLLEALARHQGIGSAQQPPSQPVVDPRNG
jgi:hypothetical protein